MKKLICVLLSIALLFLLTGCDKKEVENSDDGTFISWVPRYFETEEIITIFSRSDLAPAGFIKPDDLRIIGKPEQKVAVTGPGYCDFRMFFTDANEVRINLRLVYGKSYKRYKTDSSVTDGMTSMQYLETKSGAYIERCGVRYCYRDGWLYQVVFYVDDIQMTMQVSCTSKNPYPEDQQETFYTRLLSLSDEVVLDALEELKEAIYTRWGGKERKPSVGKWLIPTGIGLGAAVVVVTGIVFWKKKKRKATVNKADEPTTEPQPQPADLQE